MKRQAHVRVVFAFGFMLMAMSYTTAEAVSYVPQSVIDQGATDTGNHKRQGSVVHLFHGATPEAVHPLVGQEVAVFREAEAGCPPEKRLVGKIRIVRLSGNHHLEAVVLEGDLRDGDVAHLGGVYGLVVPARERCEAVVPNP
jgi:hypothetical protein